MPTLAASRLFKALLPDGIKVNAADPGYTATDLNGNSGTRTVEEAAAIAVELATLGPLEPTGGFFNDGHAGKLIIVNIAAARLFRASTERRELNLIVERMRAR